MRRSRSFRLQTAAPHGRRCGDAGRRRAGRAILALSLSLSACPGPVAAASLPRLMAYHDSWRERAVATAAQTTLAQTPGYVGLVALAFARPDMTYRGDGDLRGTGLEYRFDARTLHDAIALLKHRHPATRVLVSVGGATYRGWDRLDAAAVARLVGDLGADGADIDYETPDPGCARGADGRIGCAREAELRGYVRRLRAALPRPALLSLTAVSVGAYGEGRYRDALPTGGPYVGSMLGVLRAPEAVLLDLVSIDAYDAGASFDPLTAYRAYRAVWRGPLRLGVEVRLAGGEGPFLDASGVTALARKLARDPQGGIMVYPMLEGPAVAAPSSAAPDGAALLEASCRGLGLGRCAPPAVHP